MKKLISILTSAMLIATMVTGCGTTTNTNKDDDQKIKVVSTIFPLYDWTKSIIGENADNIELTMLLDDGVDLHSFQPTVDDIVKISECDLFIYVGGESDTWVDDALKNATNKDMEVINLMDVIGDDVKQEELVEGMEEHDHEHEHEDGEEEHDHEHEHEDGEEEHDHEHEHEDGEEEHDHEHEDGEEHHHEEVENDEHVWLSLNLAEDICAVISDKLEKIDTDNAKKYEENADKYIDSLEKLDNSFSEVVENSPKDTLLFGDRFPFRYLLDDYDLDYYAAFVGCSAETEASFETVTFLANKVDELKLSKVLTIEGTVHDVAKTIVSNTKDKNQEILVLDSMQSTKKKDVEDGVTYLSIMEKNLDIIEEALK